MRSHETNDPPAVAAARTAPRRPSRRLLTIVVVVCASVAVAVLVRPWGRTVHAPAHTVRIVIPNNAAERVAHGERLNVVPDRIVAHVGDRILLVNHDWEAHMVGPFFVGPRERMSSLLARAGTYSAQCDLHPGRRVRIVVTQ